MGGTQPQLTGLPARNQPLWSALPPGLSLRASVPRTGWAHPGPGRRLPRQKPRPAPLAPEMTPPGVFPGAESTTALRFRNLSLPAVTST